MLACECKHALAKKSKTTKTALDLICYNVGNVSSLFIKVFKFTHGLFFPQLLKKMCVFTETTSIR